ncbi:acetyltransferase [Rossellomorea marisflavi]|uniref:Acetyltransferase n=1 Tax=Rossellomorea marisflavi TaxID=189381 RepID=A0A0J5SIB5_9BACI|nr:acetyltransferase [Rossellomorea marisflavi]KML06206.1 acetyltransferase [Rossellomorea marisflavi]KML32594.1 acetyltransferase [Rossellomorea marisflavi]KZE49571.1 acetyltransferase [Rossellomorea marisflavi]
MKHSDSERKISKLHTKIVSTEEQLQEVFSIRKSVFVEEQNVPAEDEIDQYEEESTHFLLYDEDHPVGAGRFRVMDGKGKAERICILSSLRGRGAGREIMRAIEDYAREMSLPVLKLNAQSQAIPFYEKLGYEIVSEEFLDAGIPHRTMEKSL